MTKQLPVLLAILQVHEKVGALLEGPGLRRRKFNPPALCPPLNAQRALTCPLPVPQDSVSVHRPGFYASRFLKFMSTRVFRKNQCKSEPIRSLMLSGAGNPALINRVCREPSNLQPHHTDALCVYYGMERCSGLGGLS